MIEIPSEVEYLLTKDGTRKNIRLHFPDGEEKDICNDRIVLNSVKLNESLCSQNQIKLGLCEATTFQCEVVNVDDIYNAVMEVEIDIDTSTLEVDVDWESQTSEDLPYPYYAISLGHYKVQSCKREASDMTHRKINATDLFWAVENFETKFDAIRKLPAINPDANTFNIFKWLYSNCGDKNVGGTETSIALEDTFAVIAKIPHDPRKPSTEENAYIAAKCKQVKILLTDDNLRKIKYSRSRYNMREIRKANANYENGYLQEFLNNDAYGLLNAQLILESRDGDKFLGGFSNEYIYTYTTGRRDFDKAVICIPYQLYFTTSIREPMSEDECYAIQKGNIRDPNDIHMWLVSNGFWEDINLAINREQYIRHIEGEDIPTKKWVSQEYPNIRDVIQSTFEILGEWGRYGRDGYFDFVNAKAISGLYPNSDEYPNSNVFPQGTKGYYQPKMYQSAWYDEHLTLPYGAVKISYTDTNGNRNIETYYMNGFSKDSNKDSYLTYDLTSNYLLGNINIAKSVVDKLMARFISNIKDVRYMPCELKSLGMPHLEVGDSISIQIPEGEFRTVILKRTLSGEQLLTDKIQSN